MKPILQQERRMCLDVVVGVWIFLKVASVFLRAILSPYVTPRGSIVEGRTDHGSIHQSSSAITSLSVKLLLAVLPMTETAVENIHHIPHTTTMITRTYTTNVLLLLLGLWSSSLLPSTTAFFTTLKSSSTRHHPNTRLHEVIEPLETDAVYFDQGAGGVRLAAESALKIVGQIQHKPGQADAKPQDLFRYTQLQQVSTQTVQTVLQQCGHSVLCTGQGVELYKDPGETTIKEVKYAPMEAMKDSLQSAGSAMSSTSLVFNFLGGDDLVLGQVLDAAQALTLDLDIPTKCRIAFHSCSHASVPAGTCAVTVVSVNESNDTVADSSDVEKAIASGEVYLRDGAWYTLAESDMNTAVE
jgi:hypothetical protein